MTITGTHPRRMYYGWIIMILCMVTLMLDVGTTTNAYPLYVLSISDAYGLSRASANTGMILMNAGSAMAALVVGRLLDRYSPRAVMGVSAVVLGVCLLTLSFSHSLLLSAVVISFPVGFAMAGIGSLTAPTLVARWFVVHRGRAMAIVMMGNSLGTIFMVPPLAWLIVRVGWRASLIAIAVLVMTIILAALPFIRNWPGPGDQETEHPPVEEELQAGNIAEAVPLNARQLFASPRFWAVGLSTAVAMAVFQGTLVSLVPIGRGIGLSMTTSASLLSILGVAAIAAKIVVAFAGDRFNRVLMLAGAYILMSLSSVVFLFAQTYPVMLTACVMLGVAAGVTMPLYLALLADQFGTKAFGSANGNITFLISVAGACALRFSGEVFDRTGAYSLMFVTYAVLAVAAAILVGSIGKKAPMIHLGAVPAVTD
jgi:predicted MFS family arabinose efflux permease